MINLLPPQEKRALKLENQNRVVVVLAITLATALICLILILFSLKFYVAQELVVQKAIIENASEPLENVALAEKIQEYNMRLVAMNVFYKNQFKVVDSLRTLLSVDRPAGISFTSLDAQKNIQGNGLNVSISGVSNTRADLIIFKDSLQKNALIENIYFPPESWVTPSDIDFYITLTIKKDV